MKNINVIKKTHGAQFLELSLITLLLTGLTHTKHQKKQENSPQYQRRESTRRKTKNS